MKLFAMFSKLRQTWIILPLLVFTTNIQAAVPVSVKVYGQHIGNRVIYNYRLINNSTESISSIWIGHVDKNNSTVNDVRELTELPVGWDFYKGTPPDSVTSPPGWKFLVIVQEENPKHAVTWSTADDSTPVVLPGQTLTGMSVALDKADDSYWAGHASFRFSSGPYPRNPNNIPLEKLDTTPPVVSVTATPNAVWPPNNKLVAVTITLSVKDDYDPQPEIKLESITSNEVLAPGDIQGAAFGTDDLNFSLMATRSGTSTAGRIYTITYSVTDGTGNKSTATTTVIVPHDQGKK